jgi:hypothetical protein
MSPTFSSAHLFRIADDFGLLRRGRARRVDPETFLAFAEKYATWSKERDQYAILELEGRPQWFRAYFSPASHQLAGVLETAWYYDEMVLDDPISWALLNLVERPLGELPAKEHVERAMTSVVELLAILIPLRDALADGTVILLNRRDAVTPVLQKLLRNRVHRPAELAGLARYLATSTRGRSLTRKVIWSHGRDRGKTLTQLREASNQDRGQLGAEPDGPSAEAALRAFEEVFATGVGTSLDTAVRIGAAVGWTMWAEDALARAIDSRLSDERQSATVATARLVLPLIRHIPLARLFEARGLQSLSRCNGRIRASGSGRCRPRPEVTD